jgi:catechol 2,3-dioxygenase-like lactoylglutathione lyase family enzyme
MNEQEYWFHHVGVSVSDFEGSIGWYENILGFTCQGRFNNPAIPAQMAMMRNGDMHVELLCVPGSATVPNARRIPDEDLKTCGNKHISFACAEVPAAIETIRARGGDVVWIKDNGGDRINAFIRDHEGNLIEFMQRARVEGNRAWL